ncbi:hypothetical protein [Virgibacillus salexigens]|uniref:Uncharacterized protein n=1 Tax=Virgibacillus massiliensis TaxID=1462526 RepID=A0A024QED4_9BACI|nr:hypothetical protein [Virgibacillus massiliensis]CDQ40864.1 hypothetical protein BN990_03197 [Virgibacillus massiliensis]
MKGRTIVFILIIVTLIALALCWFWLQEVIVDYDLEKALHQSPERINCTIFLS